MVLAVAVAALILDVSWSAFTARRSLAAVEHHLRRGTQLLLDGQVPPARQHFDMAQRAATRTTVAVRRRAARLVAAVPSIRDDVAAIRALAAAGGRAATGAMHLADGAEASGWGTGRELDLEGQGIDLEGLRSAAPSLAAAVRDIEDGVDRLRRVRTAHAVPPLRAATSAAMREMADAARVANIVKDVVDVIPRMAGARGPRSYLLALQNLNAPRGTGGFLGIYGILRADEGRLRLGRFRHVSTLRTTDPVDGYPEVAARYGRYGGLTHLIAANYSPDFPTSASVLLDTWASTGRRPMDGVVAVDAVFMSYLLEATGPIAAPAWPSPVTADNVVAVTQHDTFTLPSDEGNRAQEALARTMWEHLLERPVSPTSLGRAVARGARERHLQLFMTRAREQALLEELGADGAFRPGENPLAVVWQDATGARTGYFAEKDLEHSVAISAAGDASVTTSIRLENRAPAGPPSALLGSGTDGDPIGHYAALTNVYLPVGAENASAAVDGVETYTPLERELGHPVLMELLEAGPGGMATLDVSYGVARAATAAGDDLEYRMTVLPQPALRPDRVTLALVAPEGAEISSAAPGLEVQGRVARFEGAPVERLDLWIRFRRP